MIVEETKFFFLLYQRMSEGVLASPIFSQQFFFRMGCLRESMS